MLISFNSRLECLIFLELLILILLYILVTWKVQGGWNITRGRPKRPHALQLAELLHLSHSLVHFGGGAGHTLNNTSTPGAWEQ